MKEENFEAASDCPTCRGNGMIGGPSYREPDEGGVPCPDCWAPSAGEDAQSWRQFGLTLESALNRGDDPGLLMDENSPLRDELRQLLARGAGEDARPVAWSALTDEDRQAAFESLPDMLDGFLKKWGWLNFAKEIERRCKEKNAIAPQPAAQAVLEDSLRLDLIASNGCGVRRATNGNNNLLVWSKDFPVRGAGLAANLRAAIDALTSQGASHDH